MKAVILAAGEGKRLRPITLTRPKPLIPLAGKPLLEHMINGLKEAGITELLLIVGYKEEMIRDYFGNGSDLGVSITYKTQDEYLGTAHATGYAEEFVQDDEFLLMYGDLLVDPQIFQNIVQTYKSNDCNGLISLLRVENPEAYGIITINEEGYVEKITEKPSRDLDLGNLANAGIYIFSPQIFHAIELTEKSVRGEYEFTDSMEILIRQLEGKIIGYIITDQFWNDIGLPWQLLEANSYLLTSLKREIQGDIEENVTIEGNVYIGENTTIRAGSYIKGPCYIGKNTIIGPNAFIRPNTCIADGCHIGMSEVKNSLILSSTAVPHFNYVGDSILCERINLGAGTKIANLRFDDESVHVTVKGRKTDSLRRKLGAIIGPNVKTGINVSIMCGKKIGQNSHIGAHTLVNEDVPSNHLYYEDPEQGLVSRTKNSLK
ncbi:MAG: bifunctional sugar-1-phosphate nucleotidylyltransferase/acetyltransferase [Promethearchaeia archaeon]